MLTYHLEKGTIPVMPGDTVYCIEDELSCTVKAAQVTEITLMKNGEMTFRVNESRNYSLGKNLFLTVDEAEEAAAKIRPVPPYRFEGRASEWMPFEIWEPIYDGFFGVRIIQDDGSFKQQLAYYDIGCAW